MCVEDNILPISCRLYNDKMDKIYWTRRIYTWKKSHLRERKNNNNRYYQVKRRSKEITNIIWNRWRQWVTSIYIRIISYFWKVSILYNYKANMLKDHFIWMLPIFSLHFLLSEHRTDWNSFVTNLCSLILFKDVLFVVLHSLIRTNKILAIKRYDKRI
jgi:hypothetical protein